ncbi:MAG: Gfo/Idh/MocA family oxidoreductase [Verrucomicrobiaceae bacterium]|nr:Gfo/Idh/MocA family oxidoreductase [Verrucomicrobiaceae bacterium]
MSKNTCRWGILGAAAIARKNWQAIRHSGNGRLVAVASRNADRAAAFIAECQAQIPHHPAPRAITGYEEMIAAEDIDALYIPLPTGLRKEYLLAAAAAGKHVLCEKPCGVDANEVREVVEACAEAGVQFMDGVMFMHSDRLTALRRELDAGEAIGELKRIVSQFSFLAPESFFTENIRGQAGLEPLGSLGDLGWYCIRMALWTMRYAMPLSVRAHMLREISVPVSLSAEMDFPGGVTAGFYCSFEAHHQQWVNLSGTEGQISMRDFVLPQYAPEVGFEIERSRMEPDLCHFHMERYSRRVAVPEYSDGHPTAQETKMFRRFGELALSGRPDPHWPDIALKTQLVLDACLRSARSDGREVTL